jgi:hypothetical protein
MRDELVEFRVEFDDAEQRFNEPFFTAELARIFETGEVYIPILNKCDELNFFCIINLILFNSKKNDALAPFVFMFNKHIGNLARRYQSSERMCEMIVDRFFGLKQPLAKIEQYIVDFQSNDHISKTVEIFDTIN